ncbi:hypothetical protein BJX70DRAFT_369520 [Aspergillus crustosus]
MVHLQLLPTELLDRIFSFIAEHDTLDRGEDDTSSQELYNLCLVSQKFRDLAQPLLFRNYDDAEFLDPVAQLISFTKAIILRPELGQYVRTASIDIIEVFPEFPTDLDLLRRAVRELQLAEDAANTWVKALELFDPCALLTLLLVKTPNLRALRISQLPRLHDSLGLVRKQDPSFLSNLDQLWITCDDDETVGYDIGAYHELLGSPKMLAPTFEVGDLVGGRFPASWKQGSLAAQELAFNHCHIDAAAIQKLLQACKRIKSFTYQNFEVDPLGFRHGSIFNTDEFTAEEIHAALLPHKDTLEHFHLEYARDPMAISSPQAYQEFCVSCAKIPSFEDFPLLETIFIQHSLLPPHPRFSPHLQRLDITDCNSSIRELIAHIAKDFKAGLYPRLTEIKVLASDITKPIKLPGQIVPHGQTPEQCFLSLQKHFKGTQVDFQILPYEMSDLDAGSLYGDDDDPELHLHDGPFEFQGLGQGAPNRQDLLAQLMMMAANDPDLGPLLRGEDDGGGESDRSWETDEE